MKKVIFLILTLCLFSVSTAFAGPYLYFSWKHKPDIVAQKIIITGLPSGSLELGVMRLSNSDPDVDGEVVSEYKAGYDFSQIPDGTYTIKGKVKTKWGISPESDPFTFTKVQPGAPLIMDLKAQ